MNNTKNRSDCGSGGRRFETALPPKLTVTLHNKINPSANEGFFL